MKFEKDWIKSLVIINFSPRWPPCSPVVDRRYIRQVTWQLSIKCDLLVCTNIFDFNERCAQAKYETHIVHLVSSTTFQKWISAKSTCQKSITQKSKKIFNFQLPQLNVSILKHLHDKYCAIWISVEKVLWFCQVRQFHLPDIK